jgi:phosphatidylinositol alpha-mannosyltransferase
MSLKIGIVTEYYYPLLGGITENVHNTRLRLRQMGHEVKIITSNSNGGQFSFQNNRSLNDPDVIRLGHSIPVYENGSVGHLTVGRHLRSKMRDILEKEKFDLVHIHSPLVITLPLIALLEAKSPIVGTFHTYFERSVVYYLLRGLLQRKGMSKLKGQIFVSRSCIKAVGRYFKVNTRIIPNGVDINQFSPARLPLEKFDNNKMNLLFLSRFDPRNGLGLMLKAFKIVKAEYPDVRLIIAGDGPLKFWYKRLVPKDLENDVHFEGLVKDERPSYYATCDIFCSPIMKASFGVTLLESMASGKAIVATENVGYKDLLGPEEGILVPPNSPSEFAKAILLLLKNEKLRKEMGSNGRKKAMNYSWDKVVGEIFDYYKEVLYKQ